jgi:hypothetical protein
MNTVIELEMKSVYGAQTFYVISEHKDAISELTQCKSVTRGHIKSLKALGFTFVVKHPVTPV